MLTHSAGAAAICGPVSPPAWRGGAQRPRLSWASAHGSARNLVGGRGGLSTALVAFVAAATGRCRRWRAAESGSLVRSRLKRAAMGDVVVDVSPSGATVEVEEGWNPTLGIIPPGDARSRIKMTRAALGKHMLAYIGDTVWEYLVLKHQYQQVVRSPFTESQAVRNLKQAKTAGMLWRGDILTEKEKGILSWGMANAWRKKLRSNQEAVEQVGFEQYSAASGLRTLLGFLYIDHGSSDERLEAVCREIGLLADIGAEDALLSELTDGMFQPRPRGNFFLALAPLGHVALRLYISRYLCQRPLRDDEFIYRVKMALRDEELDLASVGFMRDDATAEELQLMKSARDQKDTYAFAFECLLGHLALNKPYRLHQVIANFGWAQPLPGT